MKNTLLLLNKSLKRPIEKVVRVEKLLFSKSQNLHFLFPTFSKVSAFLFSRLKSGRKYLCRKSGSIPSL